MTSKTVMLAALSGAWVLGAGPIHAAPVKAAAAEHEDRCIGNAFRNDTYKPEPAFPNQTNAGPPAKPSKFAVEVFATGLVHPWAVAFLPDGRMMVTERPGRMRIIGRSGELSPPIEGLPAVKNVAADGLGDLLLDRNFSGNRTLYFTYLAPLADGKLTDTVQAYEKWAELPAGEHASHPLGYRRLARARLSADDKRLENVVTILEGVNRRIVQAADGSLYVTADTPARFNKEFDDEAQRLDNTYGKVVHINSDGSIPTDNPWYGKAGARPELFSIGHKDPEGAAFNPKTGELWVVEHGPRGGDELNIARKGRNYGFPLISYGRNYTGTLLNGGKTAQEGMEQPVYFWTLAIAPSGLTFYTGDAFPEWRNSLFIGALGAKRLLRLELDGEHVLSVESLLEDRCRRIRDVRQGPEGALYVLTDEDDGELWKVVPNKP